MATKVVASNALDARVMLSVLTAVKRGDFSARLPATWAGSAGRVAGAMNDIIESNQRLERELRKLGKHVGKQALGDSAAVELDPRRTPDAVRVKVHRDEQPQRLRSGRGRRARGSHLEGQRQRQRAREIVGVPRALDLL